MSERCVRCRRLPCGAVLASRGPRASLSGWGGCTRSKRWCAGAADPKASLINRLSESSCERKLRNAHHAIKHHLVPLPVPDLVVEVLGQVQTLVDVLLKARGALQGETSRWGLPKRSSPLRHVCSCWLDHVSHLGLPHEPELEDVDVPAALDGLVAGVISDVVLLIRLEQVASTHGVAARQDSLQTKWERMFSFLIKTLCNLFSLEHHKDVLLTENITPDKLYVSNNS